MRILITGAAGMLGRDVDLAARAAGHETIPVARAELDITDAAAVATATRAASPEAVINCGAWTDVDGAEQDRAGALAVNGTGAGNVARAAAQVGAWTLHVSSDYVFDGRKREPYLESDATGPVSSYGESKLAGEHEVAAAAPGKHTIVRSSWLFGAVGRCFPRTILGLAAQRPRLEVVDDQVGCPTFTGDLATALIALAEAPIEGVLHVAAAGECSWYEFARGIVTAAGLSTEVAPVTTDRFPRPATRPAYSVMRSERGAPLLPHYTEGLTRFMRLISTMAAA